MIVRNLEGGIRLITQPDHAQLAGRIMAHCTQLAASRRRDAILHAIAEHDNGWTEVDSAPAVSRETGAVVDFVTAQAGVRQSVWPRGVARLSADPWAAALVAQHAITVYDRFRADPEWESFFAEMEDARDAMVLESDGTLDELWADYPFVRLGDLISLVFCTGWTDEQSFGGWTVSRSGSRIIVTPDAFGGAVIPIEIEVRELPRGKFGSDSELRDALRSTSPTMVRGEVTGR